MTSAQPPDEVRASPKYNADVRHRPAVIANSEKHTILRCACVCLFVQNYSYDCPTGLYSALKPYMENTNTVTDQPRTTDASAAASDSNSEAFLRSLRPGDSVSAPIFLQQSSEQSDSADGFLPAPGPAGSVAAGGSTAARMRNEPGESAASALFASFWQTDVVVGGASGANKGTPEHEHSGGDLAAGPSSSSYDVSYNLLYSFYSIPNMVLPLFSGFLLNTEGSSSTSLRPLIMFLRYASLWLTAAATLIYYAVWLKSWTGMWLGRLLFGIASEISFVAWNVLIMAVFTARGGTARCANKSSTSASAPADEAPPSTSSMGPTFAMACVCCVSRLGTSASCFVGPWLCALALEPSLVFAIGAGCSAFGTLFAWTQLPAGAFASISRESNNSARSSDAPTFQRIAQCHRSNFAQHCAADAHWFCGRNANGRRSSSKAGAGRSIAIRGSSKNPAMRGDNSTKISTTTTPRSSTKGGGLVINVESPTFDATDVGGKNVLAAASAAENLGADGLGRLEDGGFTTSSDASSDSGEEVYEGNIESHLHQDNLDVHNGINIDETQTDSGFSPIKARKGSKHFSSRRTPSRGRNRNRMEEPARRQHRLKSSRAAATACRNDLKLLGRNVARLPHEFWVFAVVCVSLSGAIFPFNNVAQDVIAKIFYRDAEADSSESPPTSRSRSASAGAAPASETFEARITELLAATAPPSRTSGGSRTNAATIPAEEGTGSGISSEHSATIVFPSEQSEGQHLSGNAKAGRDLALIFLVSGLLTPLAGRIVDKSGGKHTLVLFLCCAVVAVVHLGLILETMAGSRVTDFRDGGRTKSTASMENANGSPASASASFDSAAGRSSSSSWFFLGGDFNFFPFLSWLPLPSAWTAWLWVQHFAMCSLLVCGQTMFGAVLWPSVATVLEKADAESTSDLLSTAYGVATALQNTALVVVPIAVGKLMTEEDVDSHSGDHGASEALGAGVSSGAGAATLSPTSITSSSIAATAAKKLLHGRGDLDTAHLYHSAEFLFLFLTTVALIASLFLVPASDFVLLREAIKHCSQRALLYLHFWRTRFGVVGGCGKMKQGVSCFGVQILGAGGPLSFVAGSRGGGGKDEDLDPENFSSPPSINRGADELEDIYSASWL